MAKNCEDLLDQISVKDALISRLKTQINGIIIDEKTGDVRSEPGLLLRIEQLKADVRSKNFQSLNIVLKIIVSLKVNVHILYSKNFKRLLS